LRQGEARQDCGDQCFDTCAGEDRETEGRDCDEAKLGGDRSVDRRARARTGPEAVGKGRNSGGGRKGQEDGPTISGGAGFTWHCLIIPNWVEGGGVSFKANAHRGTDEAQQIENSTGTVLRRCVIYGLAESEGASRHFSLTMLIVSPPIPVQSELFNGFEDTRQGNGRIEVIHSFTVYEVCTRIQRATTSVPHTPNSVKAHEYRYLVRYQMRINGSS
jgi:hypothetical protein